MKTKSRSRRYIANGQSKATVEEYFATIPEPAAGALNKMRVAIRSVAPKEATEVISYKIPAFKHNGILVWCAAFSNHISLFPTASVIDAFADELPGFSTSKGTVHFPLDKPLPVALIKKMVKFRVAERESKSRKKQS
jgi:uncharacterized protein YdhG (YjbR/CyaY superfamily)